MSQRHFVAQKEKRKREEEKVAKEAKLANLRIFAQRQKAAVEAAKNAQIDLILPPAAAQDNGVPERSDFVWRFKVGDDVVSCPETELKVRGNQGEVFRGKVAEIDDSTHLVTIRSWLSGRCHPAIHESRVRVAPKSANMYDYPDTRASAEDVNVGLQSQYEKEVRKNLKQEIKIAEYIGCSSSLFKRAVYSAILISCFKFFLTSFSY